MRKLLFFIAVFSFTLHSCKSDGKSEGDTQDTILVKNDSVQPEAVHETAIKKEEKIREDSLKQDSIQKIQATIKAIPSFNKLLNTKNDFALFKKLGYNVSSNKVKNALYDVLDFEDPYVTLTKATKELGNGAMITYQQDICGSYKMTIKGMPKVLENYYKETKAQVKQFNRKYGDDIFYITVEKHGDNITVEVPCN